MADPAADSVALGGRFRVTALLGGGGVTHAALGIDLVDGREVVVKSPAAEWAKPLLRNEAALLDRLRSDCWPKRIALLDEPGGPWLVMERIVGRPIFLGSAPWPLDAVRSLVAGAAEALAALHGLGYVHCDIKPSNLLHAAVAPETRLIDFNVARPIGSATGGQFVGTAPYMAPELWRGDPVSPGTVVYALAAMAATLLAGGPLFRATTRVQWMVSHLETAPARLDDLGIEVPATVESAISDGLAKAQEARPLSVAEFARRLGR